VCGAPVCGEVRGLEGAVAVPVAGGGAAFREFVEHVVIPAWLVRFEGEPGEKDAFLDELCDASAASADGYGLDYVRLNIEATLGKGPR